MSILGSRIKELRLEKGLSQTIFGKHFGTDKTTVSKWERGKYKPDPETIAQIATFFQVTTDYLLGESIDVSSPKLDLKEIKKAIQEKELVFGERELPKKQQDAIRAILLAAIEREEAEEN